MKKIANIVNFCRSVEPRSADDGFLLPTLEKELALCRAYGWRSTVLFQYDALIRADYRDAVRACGDAVEKGLWLEVVQPLCREAGLPWAGRYVWDWEKGCNLLSHYTPAERRLLIDAAFEGFRRCWGDYPEVVGCWMLDSASLRYMYEKYRIRAACICRDQSGTDCMTLWGGYYNGGYYPCFNNILCPASSPERQIGVPVFRMLGPDPIYQYDMGLGEPDRPQSVCTLEPVYAEGGGSERWVEWYLNENYNDKCLSHAYAQFGQENSFGMDQIFPALSMQFRLLKERVDRGEIELMTLGETGTWYKESFALTAPAAMCTDSDWQGRGYRSVWYASRHYRINLLYRNGAVWIRDLQLFDENYSDAHLSEKNAAICTGSFNLPVTDGFRFSKDGVRAGIYVKKDGVPLKTDAPFESEAIGEEGIRARAGGVCFTLLPETVEITLPEDASLVFEAARVPYLPYRQVEKKTLLMGFSGFGGGEYPYALRLKTGFFTVKNGLPACVPENGRIVFEMQNKREDRGNEIDP